MKPGDDFMSKCPLCEIDYPHSHFSYDIAEYVDALQSKLEQRIAMEIDEHAKVVSLQAKLDVAVEAMMRANLVVPMTDIGIRNFHILDDALAAINGGMNDG